MPPASFCNSPFPEHASAPSDLRQAEVASHLLPNGDIPFGLAPTELPQARGHLAFITASTPTPATARRGGFTPT
jgi:hypothetical protein